MLKLLRVENTNTFIVVSEEDFVKSMKIEGVVRIEEDYHDDDIKVFEPKDEDWHEQVFKLKGIKRKELYSSEDKRLKRLMIPLKTILIHYFKESSLTYISVKKLCSLVVCMYESLKNQDKLELYNIDFDIAVESLERTLLYNADIFAFSGNLEDNSIIYCAASLSKIKELANKYPLDETILNIIQTFIREDY